MSFVERTRRLHFRHPVKVRFLSDAAFRAAAASWYGDTTPEDREMADLESADLLALGLVTAPFDSLGAEESSDVEDTTGWYDQKTQTLTIRGTHLDDTEVRLTIVHELTHALQDQRFDLDALDDRAKSGGASTALSALVEGDATRIEHEYLWSLPQRTQDAYWNTLDDSSGPVTEPEQTTPTASPLVFDLWDSFDYDLSPTALEIVVKAHGPHGVDELFKQLPRSEEAIVDPVALERRDAPIPVKLPAFAPGETARGPADDWGAYSWYLVLASRIPWQQALAAVEGWGGDRYRSYVQTVDGVERGCVRAAVIGDTDVDTAELETALVQWAAALPSGAAQVVRDGARSVVSACTTGVAPSSADGALQLAYNRLWERTNELWYFTDAGNPPDRHSLCISDALVADPVAERILSLERDVTTAERQVLDRRISAATDHCA